MKKYIFWVFIFGIIFSFCGCGKENTLSLSESLETGIQQSDNGSKSTPVAEEYNIHIKNSKGEIDIKDDKLAEELVNIVGNPKKIIETGTSCPFGNKVTISKNQETLKEFLIAEDGCYTIKRADGSIFEIQKTIYEKVEGALNTFHNSLNRVKNLNIQ